VDQLAFSGDGQILASLDVDGTVILWDVARGQVRGPLAVHSPHDPKTVADVISAITFVPGTRVLVVGSRKGVVRLIDTAAGDVLGVLAHHEHFVRSVAVDSTGKLVASISQDGHAKMWSLEPRKELWHDDDWGGWPCYCITFAASGKSVASNPENCSRVKLCDPLSGHELLWLQSGMKWPIKSLAFSADGGAIAGGAADGVRIWNATTGHVLRTLRITCDEYVDFSADGLALATAGRSSLLRLWLTSKVLQ
jgi:WD40 repeat protein